MPCSLQTSTCQQLWLQGMSLHNARLAINGNFKTVKGTIRVSKPYRSQSTKKHRVLITFEPRKLAFDISNENSITNEFCVSFCDVLVQSVPDVGHPRQVSSPAFGRQSSSLYLPFRLTSVSLKFATLFSQHATVALSISDVVLVLSTPSPFCSRLLSRRVGSDTIGWALSSGIPTKQSSSSAQ